MSVKEFKNPCHCFNFRRAVNSVTNLYNDKISSSGLSASQFSILGSLQRLGTASVSGLSDEVGLERTTVVRSIKPLVNRGFIEDISEEGSRSKVLRLTDEGCKVLAEATERWREAQKELEMRLGKENIESLYEIISVIQRI